MKNYIWDEKTNSWVWDEAYGTDWKSFLLLIPRIIVSFFLSTVEFFFTFTITFMRIAMPLIVAGIFFVIFAVVLALSMMMSRNSHRTTSSPPSYESTEDKLRRVYDSQGIRYDDKTLHDDANAIDQLHRESTE